MKEEAAAEAAETASFGVSMYESTKRPLSGPWCILFSFLCTSLFYLLNVAFSIVWSISLTPPLGTLHSSNALVLLVSSLIFTAVCMAVAYYFPPRHVALICIISTLILTYVLAWPILRTLSIGQCRDQVRVDYFILTIPRNIARSSALMSRLEASGVSNVSMFMGYDGKDFDNTAGFLRTHDPGAYLYAREPHGRRSPMALTMGLRHLMIHALNTSTADWIVVFEDDAYPVSWFRNLLWLLACHSQDDVVWLDTRMGLLWNFLSRVDCCTAGMAYHRTALPEIIASLLYESNTRTSLAPQLSRFDPYDLLLAAMCKQGMLKCAGFPVVSESGVDSSQKYRL